MSDVTIKKGKDMLGVIVYGTEYLVDYDFFKDSLDKYVDAEDRILICHVQKKGKDEFITRYIEESGFEERNLTLPHWCSNVYIRNKMIVHIAKECCDFKFIVFWNGKINATRNLIKEVERENVNVHVVEYRLDEEWNMSEVNYG